MPGEILPVKNQAVFLSGLYPIASTTKNGVVYRFYTDQSAGVPVIYRSDTNNFWHITLPELLELAQCAGLDAVPL